ncbi:response regulator [Paenibacillus filicis]|uniref:Response regulator n=1 Tax=Paenibacillus filicis TaxID=669464 RepID=A0ABU9DTS9_9BACL
MKIMLVDDEPLALRLLAEELEHIGGLDIIGTFRNPRAALDAIVEQGPQAVFLDIEMPEMSGIQLAELILERRPDTMIVFVTVYDEYAVKAFELQAMDYVLKPVQAERLAKTIERLKLQQSHRAPVMEGLSMIHCFRSLQFERRGRSPLNLRWKTLRAQELFCFLLQYRGRPVRKQLLVEQLWSEIEWKKGISQLYTAIYQIRKMLQDEQLPIRIENCDEGYRLDLNGVKLDTEKWEESLDSSPSLSRDTVDIHKRLSAQYAGDYLAEYAYHWAEKERGRLRARWLAHGKQLGNFYIANGDLTDAAAHYLSMQSVLPLEESLYVELMRLYDVLDDRRSVEAQYEQLRNVLLQELDSEPDESIRIWVEETRKSRR